MNGHEGGGSRSSAMKGVKIKSVVTTTHATISRRDFEHRRDVVEVIPNITRSHLLSPVASRCTNHGSTISCLHHSYSSWELIDDWLAISMRYLEIGDESLEDRGIMLFGSRRVNEMQRRVMVPLLLQVLYIIESSGDLPVGSLVSLCYLPCPAQLKSIRTRNSLEHLRLYSTTARGYYLPIGT